MIQFKDYLTEAKSESFLDIATSKSKNSETTDELRSQVAEKLNIKNMPPKIKVKSVSGFVKEYNRLLSTYTKDMQKIFDYNKNVGRGELLLACLSDDIIIGGTSQTYDVDFGTNKIEVKEVNFSPNYMNNFRLGKESKLAMKKALDQIKYLFSIAKYFYPDLNTNEFNSKVAEGQELTKLIKYLKEVDVATLEGLEEVDIFLNKKGNIYFKGKRISSLSDNNVIEVLKSLSVNAKQLKSFSEIEEELVDAISNKSIEYFFFESKSGKLIHKKNLVGSVIDTITQGSIKFRVFY